MTEMIERVALAIGRAELQWSIDNEGYGGSLNVECPDDVKARAAIEAMREPTEAMLSVGNDSTWDPEPGLARTYVGETTIKMAYETMIDAALK